MENHRYRWRCSCGAQGRETEANPHRAEARGLAHRTRQNRAGSVGHRITIVPVRIAGGWGKSLTL